MARIDGTEVRGMNDLLCPWIGSDVGRGHFPFWAEVNLRQGISRAIPNRNSEIGRSMTRPTL